MKKLYLAEGKWKGNTLKFIHIDTIIDTIIDTRTKL